MTVEHERHDDETVADDPDLAVVVSRIVCSGLCGSAAEGPQLEIGLRAMRWRKRGDKHLCPDCACIWCLGTGALFTGVMCRACQGTGMTPRALDRVWRAANQRVADGALAAILRERGGM